MPRPEQVVVGAGDDAEHGATADLQRLAAAGPPPPPTQAEAESVPAPVQGIEEVPEQDLTLGAEEDQFDELGDFQSEEEALVFGPSARPFEPSTAGMSFGEGPSLVRLPAETRGDFRSRLSRVLSAADDDTSKEFGERLARGE